MYQRFGRGDFASLQENMEWLVGASLKIAQVILLDIKEPRSYFKNVIDIIKKNKCRNGKRRSFRIMRYKRNWSH